MTRSVREVVIENGFGLIVTGGDLRRTKNIFRTENEQGKFGSLIFFHFHTLLT